MLAVATLALLHLISSAAPSALPTVCGVALNDSIDELSRSFSIEQWTPPNERPRDYMTRGTLLSSANCPEVAPESRSSNSRGFDIRALVSAGRIRAFEYRAANQGCSTLVADARSKFSSVTLEREVQTRLRRGTEWRFQDRSIVSLDFYPDEQACWYSVYFEGD